MRRFSLQTLAPKRLYLRKLEGRVERLEDEIHELRRLNRRIAELADVVQEVLLPATNRDDERLRRLLDEYSESLELTLEPPDADPKG